MNPAEVNTVIRFLNASWPNKPLDKAAAAVWGSMLRNVEARPAMTLLRELATKQDWRPTLAQILGPLSEEPGAKSVDAAFASVWEQIGKRPRDVTQLEAEAVRRMGGWEALRTWKLEERHWHLARFKDAYGDVQREEELDGLRAIASGEPRPKQAAIEAPPPSRESVREPRPKTTYQTMRDILSQASFLTPGQRAQYKHKPTSGD